MKNSFFCCLAVLPIILYQKVLSTFTLGCCRFYPSCSNYAVNAIMEHGVFKGYLLSIWRILRCHPLANGGYDPIPLRKSTSSVL